MSSLAIDTLLEEYRTQRKYREAKRNQFLRRFDVLRYTFAHVNQPHPHDHLSEDQRVVHGHGQSHYPIEVQRQVQIRHIHPHQDESLKQVHLPQEDDLRCSYVPEHTRLHVSHSHAPVEEQRLQAEQAELSTQNQFLKAALGSIQTQEKEKLQGFKVEIEQVRNRYMDEIQKLTETAKKSKEQIEGKMVKIKQQSEIAAKKNVEIEGINKQLRGEINEGNALMGTYATEIKKQYAEKIVEFEKIFDASNEKIEGMQKDFNQDEFIENTLKNEELLKSIEQNAQKAEQAGKILEDYSTLLQGKKQILGEIHGNNGMKEREIEKMMELQGKMKVIMEKLGTEKRIYVNENNRMAQELIEIKTLLMGAMNEAK